MGFPWWLSGKESSCNAGVQSSAPRSGRSPGEGNGNPLQYSCLGNPMDREASVQFSRSVVSDSLRPHELQHTRSPCPSPTPGVYSNSCPSSQRCHPLSSPSPPAFNLPQQQGLFQWVSSSHQVTKVLEFQHQHQSFQWIFRTNFLGEMTRS